MNSFAAIEHQQKPLLSHYPFKFALCSLAVILSTFALALSPLERVPRTIGFGVILLAYLAICIGFLRTIDKFRLDGSGRDKVNRCLLDLDEVRDAFSGTMRIRDVFRLVLNRIKEIIPLERGTLYLCEGGQLRTAAVFDINRSGIDPTADHDRAAACYRNCSIEADPAGNSIAIPLVRGSECFGVMQINLRDSVSVQSDLYEALGDRISPLILSSLAYEQSQANALTDATTDLPNEKAFYLILENQIAEVQRDPGVRPLAVACVDIKNFEMINKQLGHAAGDRALNFAVEIIRENLRQMDFFARAANDEFLIILPTASKEITQEVIARITTAFFGRQLRLVDEVSTEIELNFGWAAFGEDGETSGQLLKAARLRKLRSKDPISSKVLFFSREMIG